jgi:hypothetical protein
MNFEIKGGKVHRGGVFALAPSYYGTICGLWWARSVDWYAKKTSKPVTCGNCKRIMGVKKND